MKKAVIYARVSTDEQAERGTSIQAQLETCHDYAKENGLEVVKEYKEDYTGTTLDRPELNQLQDDLKNGLAIAVIVPFAIEASATAVIATSATVVCLNKLPAVTALSNKVNAAESLLSVPTSITEPVEDNVKRPLARLKKVPGNLLL